MQTIHPTLILLMQQPRLLVLICLLVVAALIDGLFDASGGGHHLHMGLAGDELLQTPDHRGMVVDDHHPDHVFGRQGFGGLRTGGGGMGKT